MENLKVKTLKTYEYVLLAIGAIAWIVGIILIINS